MKPNEFLATNQMLYFVIVVETEVAQHSRMDRSYQNDFSQKHATSNKNDKISYNLAVVHQVYT